MTVAQTPIGGMGILKLMSKMKGVDKAKLQGLLAPQPDPMAMAYQNIGAFQDKMAQDQAARNQFASGILNQRLNAVGDIQQSQQRMNYFKGIGDRYSGEGTPQPGQWMPSPDGGRLVWSDKGMWEYR